jgi:di/tricarboxylate transporter
VAVKENKLIQTADGKSYVFSDEWQNGKGVQALYSIEGAMVDFEVTANSMVLGKTIRELNFRQNYGAIVVAFRRGSNVQENGFGDKRIYYGDVLTIFAQHTTLRGFEAITRLLPLQVLPELDMPRKVQLWVPWAFLLVPVGFATFDFIPIHLGILIGCIATVLTRCLDTEEVYKAIDWSVIFLIIGTMSLGLATDKSGLAEWIARGFNDMAMSHFPKEWLPYLMLIVIYSLTCLLTELLSNAATAVIMIPLVIKMASMMALDSRPFIVAVTIASSIAFATPIGYQTNTMVYTAGNYKFMDFIKCGVPLNIICGITAIVIIPMVWALKATS